MRWAAFLAAIVLSLPLSARAAEPASPFADWATIVAAGDFKAQSGAATETFDNARRDLSAAFLKLGVAPQNLSQVSVRPQIYPDPKPLPAEPELLQRELIRLTGQAKTGCLLYFTSHGNPDGILYGEYVIPPQGLASVVNATCGERPTAVFVSACYSGVFLPPLQGPNRFIMTAARSDRTSFGCGESDVYTYFDECVLKSLPHAAALDGLAEEVKVCVAAAEGTLREESRPGAVKACQDRARAAGSNFDQMRRCLTVDVIPPSEPQVFIGETMRAALLSLPLQPAPKLR